MAAVVGQGQDRGHGNPGRPGSGPVPRLPRRTFPDVIRDVQPRHDEPADTEARPVRGATGGRLRPLSAMPVRQAR